MTSKGMGLNTSRKRHFCALDKWFRGHWKETRTLFLYFMRRASLAKSSCLCILVGRRHLLITQDWAPEWHLGAAALSSASRMCQVLAAPCTQLTSSWGSSLHPHTHTSMKRGTWEPRALTAPPGHRRHILAEIRVSKYSVAAEGEKWSSPPAAQGH